MNLKWIVWMMMGLLLSLSYGSSGTEADETAGAQGPPVQGEQIDKETQKIIEQQMKSLQQREAATFPCSLFSQSEIEALVGNALDKGSYAFDHRFENDRQYKSESCDWSAMQGEGNEVGLAFIQEPVRVRRVF